MRTGMIVLHDGAPMVVAHIWDIPTYGWQRSRSQYALAPYGSVDTEPQPHVYLVDPKAVEIPLLPACEMCGRWAGHECFPDCPAGTLARVPS